MIICGYFFIFLYGFFLIFVLGSFLKVKYDVEVSRKVIHILLLGMWPLINTFMINTVHQIIVPTLFLCINFLSYHYNFFHAIERKEDNHKGTIYFALAIALLMMFTYFEPRLHPYAGMAVICLTLGDGFAGLIGYSHGSQKIYKRKTIVGSLACFVFSAVGCWLLNFLLFTELKWYDILIISIIVAIVELVDFGLDNLMVPFVSLLVACMLAKSPSSDMYIGLVSSILVFAVVFLASAIDYYGSLISMVIVFCYAYYGKVQALIYLLLLYFTIFVIAICKKRMKNMSANECREEGKTGKKAIQIIANGGMGTIFIIIYGIVGKPCLFLFSLICISGCFVDSISSDIGVLSHKKPYDFIKRKYVDTGVSGGVSTLGMLMAAVCSMVLAFAIVHICKVSAQYYVAIAIIIFSQTLTDSLFGSLIQVKKQCPKCGKITEKEIHCQQITMYYSGLHFVDNNIVNILSSVVTSIFSVIFLYNA